MESCNKLNIILVISYIIALWKLPFPPVITDN